MNENDVCFLPAHTLAREIAARRLSSKDATDALLARIARMDGRYHAFAEVYEKDARQAARSADLAIGSGHPLGPLHGVPVALKDLIDLAGRVTTSGSMIWQNRRATTTAVLARHLIREGMVILGKTHLVEFATGGWGTNRRLGTPLNPWSPDRAVTPGGSSSGSGVAVAAGLAPWAVGTDTGGSVRLPAAWCGITGLKVTAGRISTEGVRPLSRTLDTPGPMARSVEDVAILYRALRGPEAGAPDLRHRPSLRGLRLARMPASERQMASADVLAAYDESLKVLDTLGAEIVDIAMPCGFAELFALNGTIMAAEGYTELGDIVDDMSLPLDEDVRPRLRPNPPITARQYLTAVASRETLKRAFATALEDVDGLLTPTTRTVALPLDAVDQTTQPTHFTRPFNFLDFCGLAVPNGTGAGGLPTSLQIVCKSLAEDTAIRIGLAYQEATTWHLRRPPELPS